MSDFAEILKEAGACIDALYESCETFSGSNIPGMVERLRDFRKRLDAAIVEFESVKRIVPQYRLETPYSFTEEQATRLASVEWRRGMDEAIAFLYRHSNEEHFGEGFAEMLEEYADKCVGPKP